MTSSDYTKADRETNHQSPINSINVDDPNTWWFGWILVTRHWTHSTFTCASRALSTRLRFALPSLGRPALLWWRKSLAGPKAGTGLLPHLPNGCAVTVPEFPALCWGCPHSASSLPPSLPTRTPPPKWGLALVHPPYLYSSWLIRPEQSRTHTHPHPPSPRIQKNNIRVRAHQRRSRGWVFAEQGHF